MKRRIFRKALRELESATAPGSVKNVYETYDTHKEAGDLLVRLCTKVAAPLGPKVMAPRLMTPGAASGVGRWNPGTGSAGRAPTAPGAKIKSPTDVINPNRSVTQAMTAFTPRKSTA